MKKSILSLLTVSLVIAGTIFTLQVQAFNENDAYKFTHTGKCPNCDLSGFDFPYNDYSPEGMYYVVTYTRVNLQGANLTGVRNYRIDMRGANLQGANLTNSNWRECNLIGVNFKGANLRGASFIDASVAGANFEGADLRGARWTDAYICGPDSIGVCNKTGQF